MEVQVLFDLLALTLSRKMYNKTVASGAISTVVLISSFDFLFLWKAFSLLANHMLSNMKIRKTEQRREGLLARLNVDADQLLGE